MGITQTKEWLQTMQGVLERGAPNACHQSIKAHTRRLTQLRLQLLYIHSSKPPHQLKGAHNEKSN